MTDVLYTHGGPVDSTALMWFGWDSVTEMAYVTFWNGETWSYNNFDKVDWENACEANSIGSHYTRVIKRDESLESDYLGYGVDMVKREDESDEADVDVVPVTYPSPEEAIAQYVKDNTRFEVTILIDAKSIDDAAQKFGGQHVVAVREVVAPHAAS